MSSVPEAIHTVSIYTNEEMRREDLPKEVAEGEATALSNVVTVIHSEIGSLGRPGLVSEGLGHEEVTSSSASESADSVPSSPEITVLTSREDVTEAIRDGRRVHVHNETSASSQIKYIPRGHNKDFTRGRHITDKEREALIRKQKEEEEKKKKKKKEEEQRNKKQQVPKQ